MYTYVQHLEAETAHILKVRASLERAYDRAIVEPERAKIANAIDELNLILNDRE
jgi:hypothetical protein